MHLMRDDVTVPATVVDCCLLSVDAEAPEFHGFLVVRWRIIKITVTLEATRSALQALHTVRLRYDVCKKVATAK